VPDAQVSIGAVLAGKYRVERVLGQGGMGVVVEATQLDLERRVALKFLRQSAVPEQGSALTRFEREARTIARLRGEHIVQIYDVGRLEHGEAFIVMELLTGEDLSALLDREQRLPVATAVDYVLQACEAMAEAHVAGVIHRDLKPANLFLSKRADGRPLLKVLDFGISKLLSETTSLSLTSGVLGSPLYMSPEQLASSKDIDARTDVWSLGTILYELLTGSPAFQAEGLPQVCARIMAGTADPIGSELRDIPPGLEAVLVQCLRRYPEERYASVADLAAALIPFARKSSLVSAEAAIRIVQGSSLAHGPLPRMTDSLPPPSLDSTNVSAGVTADKTVSSGPPFSFAGAYAAKSSDPAAPTVNVSAPPPPTQTQGDLEPLAFPATSEAVPAANASRVWVWGMVTALAALAAIVATLQLAGRGQSPAAAVSAEPAAASSPPPAPSSPQLAAEPAGPPSAEPAPIATPTASTRPPVPVGKPRPAAIAKPRRQPTNIDDSEKLLNHR
jgi:eukaryotic-like serine/threonine-protein kinase